MKIEASVIIERPIEAVWEFIADPSNNPKWDPGTLEVRQTSEGPIGVGTTLEAVVRLFGRRSVGLRITAFEPNREVRFEFVSGFLKPSKVRYALESVDPKRTRLTRVVMEPALSGAVETALAALRLDGEKASRGRGDKREAHPGDSSVRPRKAGRLRVPRASSMTREHRPLPMATCMARIVGSGWAPLGRRTMAG